MALLVHVTEACRRDAARQTVADVVERVRQGVEAKQSLSLFDPFPPPYLVKKKLKGRQQRLIAEVREVEGHQVVVFLAVMIRSSREYENDFCRDPAAYGARQFADLVDEQTLQRLVHERMTQGSMPVRPQCSEAEYSLLYSTFLRGSSDSGRSESAEPDALDRNVFESHEWVGQVAESIVARQLSRLASTCEKALSGTDGLQHHPAVAPAGWGIWTYRRADHLLLLSIDDGQDSAAREARMRDIARALDAGGGERMMQESRRAYPAIVMADEGLWLDLEQEPVANMALSPEESGVLDSARRSRSPFPLFINGRAGSGKSTILQYLFADLLQAYAQKFPEWQASAGQPPGPPVYLTANGELLRNARRFVSRLLTAGVNYTALGGGFAELDKSDQEPLLDRAFRVYRNFLLELIPQEQANRFQPSNRVDYPRFRQLWQKRFGRDPRAVREHGPDVSWHVIRTYVKGMGSEESLDPEDYAQLPDNQLSVGEQTFRAVHDQVWSRWYATVGEEGLWDDQDLARFILDQDLVPRNRSGVFCDEAQDFTRVELEVLLRLNLYSNRQLPAGDVSRVPFAFAGDEFQTLNPTGFRWDAVKASFVEKFIYELDPARRSTKADLNYRELSFNYRSTTPIVKLGNVVQALRSASLSIPELRPQRAWQPDGGGRPVLYFRAQDLEFWLAFRERASAFVIVVPCNEGEEAEFVAKDTWLREHVQVSDGVPRNVLSASRAKGCEYPAVIVYGFGEACPHDLVGPLGGGGDDELQPQALLALQYFVNRVYVAVSRAKDQLIVVDTDQGSDRLWKVARDEFARERLICSLKRGQDIWSAELGMMSPGRSDDLSSEVVPDRRANALAFEEDGRAKRDAYLMMQAASTFRELGDGAKFRQCRALALDYDDKPFEAGSAFADAGMLEDAVRCLWRAERPGWLRLQELAREHPELLVRLEVRWATALRSKPDLAEAARLLDGLRARLAADAEFARSVPGDGVWRVATDALLSPLLSQGGPSLQGQVCKALLVTLEQLAPTGVELQDSLLTDLLIAAGELEKAVLVMEAQGDRRSQRYLAAKARVAPFPACLEFLERLGDSREVLEAIDGHPGVELGTDDARIAVSAMLKLGMHDRAVAAAGSVRSPALCWEAAVAAKQAGALKAASSGLRQWLATCLAAEHWDPFTKLASQEDPADPGSTKDTAIRQWTQAEVPSLQLEMIRLLARSDQAKSAPASVEQALGRFLRDFLRVKNGKWKSSLSLMEAGSAIERWGRVTDALQYYEAVLNEPVDGQTQDAARRRWMSTKVRQLELERSRPRVDESLLARIKQELGAQSSKWRLAPQEVEPFPLLPPIGAEDRLKASQFDEPALGPIARAIGVQAPGRPSAPAAAVGMLSADQPSESPVPESQAALQVETTFEIDGLRVEVKRSHSICLITHLVSLETVRVDWARQKLTASAEASLVDGAWHIDAWPLQLVLSKETREVVRIVLPRPGLDLAIRG
jgi:hypothetical protein